MPAATKRKRGRPRKPDGEKRRNNVTIRMRDDVKRRMEEGAYSEGRSLSEEVEARIEGSLSREDDLVERFGGIGQYRWMLLLAATLQMVEKSTGEKWDEDAHTNALARGAIEECVDRFSPKHPERGLLKELSARSEGAVIAKAGLDGFFAGVRGEEEKRQREGKN